MGGVGAGEVNGGKRKRNTFNNNGFKENKISNMF